jgi:hypothetical protein
VAAAATEIVEGVWRDADIGENMGAEFAERAAGGTVAATLNPLIDDVHFKAPLGWRRL